MSNRFKRQSYNISQQNYPNREIFISAHLVGVTASIDFRKENFSANDWLRILWIWLYGFLIHEA